MLLPCQVFVKADDVIETSYWTEFVIDMTMIEFIEQPYEDKLPIINQSIIGLKSGQSVLTDIPFYQLRDIWAKFKSDQFYAAFNSFTRYN